MPEFLAETYAPRNAAGTAAPRAAGIAWAAGRASGPGAPVRFLGAVAVPGEETGFWLYQAPTAEAVRAAMTAARLRPERIAPAVTLRPRGRAPRPAPARHPAARDPSWVTDHHPSTCLLWSPTMSAFTRAPRSRPTSAPVGYPAWPGGRPAPAARQQPAQDPDRDPGVTRGMPAEVREHLRRHHVITLSTTSFTGMPRADTVVYTSDADSIFFVAGAGTPMLRNLQDSRWVSFTIDEYSAGWAKVRELQGAGRCLPATAAQHAAAWPLYAAKFGPGFARPSGLLHAIVRSTMHFVDHHHAAEPARLRRTAQAEDTTAPRPLTFTR